MRLQMRGNEARYRDLFRVSLCKSHFAWHLQNGALQSVPAHVSMITGLSDLESMCSVLWMMCCGIMFCHF